MLQIPTAKLQFTIVRNVKADPATVFDVLTSESGMKSWISFNRRVEWRHPAGATQPGVGSVRYIVLAGGIVAAERILAWDAGRGLHYTFAESSLPISKFTRNYVGVTQLDPIAAGVTRLTWSVHFDPASGLAAILVKAGLRPAISMMSRNIARIAQTQRP